jgi:hypothetical protein
LDRKRSDIDHTSDPFTQPPRPPGDLPDPPDIQTSAMVSGWNRPGLYIPSACFDRDE